MMNKISKILFLACLLFAQSARADYVGELETTKYFDPATVALIKSRLPGGLVTGDQISYFIQFTPTDNGGNIGAGSFMTDYIPSGTQVVDAQFVHLNSDGSYTKIAPPTPAAVFPAFLPMYTDTGVFYSTDARTAKYPSLASTAITPANGYALATPGTSGCTGISLPSTTHNIWDSVMYNKFYNVAGLGTTGTCTVPSPAFNATTYNTSGLSPVAGPNTFLTLDSTGAVGPWQRISYPGSLIGTSTGVAVAGTNNGTAVTNACVGGTPTAAGWNLSAANPLPINTNAVRFAAGKVTVGELFTVRITLKLTANMPAAGIGNNTEVFGGDVGLDMGNAGTHPSNWNQWHYDCPAVAVSNSQLLVQKSLVGACTGTGCTPTAIAAGVVPSAANLKLRYQVQYVNLSGAAQTSVVLTDTLATGAVYVAGTYVLVSGTGTGAPTGTTTLTFPAIASLGSGASGLIQYDVTIATAPVDGTALINTAKLVSAQVPTPGVTSKAIATVSTQANLWISKSTSTPSVAPGNVASYTITIPNNGTTPATSVVVNDYLPSAGGTTVNNRFTYLSIPAGTCGTNAAAMAAGQGCITTAAGVGTVVTLTQTGGVSVVAPYIGLNREQVIFTLPAATAIPMGGKLTINFNATVGSLVPASTTPYLNNANVWYAGGSGGAAANSSYSETIGTAPVYVTAPMSLVATVDCVYAGVTCVPYTNGTISPLSKIKYKLSYTNANPVTINSVVLTDTLPPNTAFVAGTAKRDGAVIADPSVVGQVLTFASFSSPSSTSGYISFDVQLGAGVTAGTDITNTGKITAPSFPSGVTASVTTSVRNGANLLVTKTATPSTIALNGTVTYTITVSNTGDAAASGIKIYDELPFTGTTLDTTKRFNYVGPTVFATTDPALLAVTPTTSAPTFAGYTGNTNQQQILWAFAAANTLGAGKSFTLTYTATAGSAVTSKPTPYTSDVQAEYISSTSTQYASTINTAPVTIPSNLSVTTTIDCVYEGAVCNAYNPADGYVPADAKIRYKTHYVATVAQTNVYICNQLPTQTGTFAAAVSTPSVAPTPAGSYFDSPAIGTRVSPANAACGFGVGGITFSYPVIGSLAANASGDVYFDVQTVGTAQGDTVTDTGKIVSASAPTGETSVSSVFVSLLQISKTTSTSSVSIGGKATYTVEIANTSATLSATNFKLYDFLPTSGGTTSATNFTYDAGSAAFTAATTWPTGGMSAAPALSNPPTLTAFSYNAATNMQQLLWDFTGKTLLPGGKIFITYTATVGSSVPTSVTYGSDLYLDNGTTPIHEVNVAPVTVTVISVNHYELRLPSTGISCMPTTVTVIACPDTSNPCTAGATTVSGKTVTLATSAGTLGATTVTFDANGLGTTTLSYPTATDGTNGTATANTSNVTISGASTAPSTGYQCCPDGASCSASNAMSCASMTTFNREGFIFSASAGGGEATIPTQKAGVSDATYYLRAVKKGTANQCVPALSGAQNILFAYECNDPTTCAGSDLMAVNGGTNTTVARNDNGAFTSYWLGPSFTSVPMKFDINGNAGFTFVYSDVGKVKLHAKFTNSNGGKMEGYTFNSFVVKPNHFTVIPCLAAPCAASPADPGIVGGGNRFIGAGNAFSATIEARALNGTTPLPSYGLGANAATETVLLASTLTGPAGGIPGTLAGTGTGAAPLLRNSFIGGARSVNDLRWDEVGVITLTAASIDFLNGAGDGSGDGARVTTGTSGNLGRFTPDHFDTVVTGSMDCGSGLTCPTSTKPMVYSGQVFATVTVTAKNAVATTIAGVTTYGTTKNYKYVDATTSFAKAVTLSAVNGVTGTTPASAGTLGGTLSLAATAFPNPGGIGTGIGTLTSTSATNTGAPIFTFTTPPTLPTDVYLNALDTDLVASGGTGFTQGGVKVVSGRVRISNAHGSELLPLPITATVQFYSGATWVRSTTDNSTSLTLAATYPIVKNGVPTGTTTPSPMGAATVIGGNLNISLSKPTLGSGSATVNPGSPNYLQPATGLATFGVYKGNNAFIYLRENY